MNQGLNRFLDATSDFLARRKGLLPILHLGVILAILGLMLAWAL
jgi:hypothetical protein